MNTDNDLTKRKVIVAYHANCLDGFTAAWVTTRALGAADCVCTLQEMEYTELSYHTLAAKVKELEPSLLYIVDFSVPLEFLSNLKRHCPKTITTILDHHKTAFENYVPHIEVTPDAYVTTNRHRARIVLDNAHSGAGLCWKYLMREAADSPLVAYVEDYDLWRFAFGDETKWVNKYLIDIPKTLGNWDILAEEFSDPKILIEILAKGEKLQEEHDREVRYIASKAKLISITGLEGLYIECPDKTLVSDVGHALAEKCGTFGAMTYKVEGGIREWSLRGVDAFDVSALAKVFGGGGHKGAAGFRAELDDSRIVYMETGVIGEESE